jgi:actin-like ATPase involved in cell morphogenesis
VSAEDELAELTAELRELAPKLPKRLETDEKDIEAGVAKLVLTLVEFIRQVLEHQAIRRMEGGSLSDEEVERLGLALMRLQEKLQELKSAFGIKDEDLNVDLGPLGRLL